MGSSKNHLAGVLSTLRSPKEPAPPGWVEVWGTSFHDAEIRGHADGRGKADHSMRATDILVALPSKTATGRRVKLLYRATGKQLRGVVVGDLGPHNGVNKDDTEYLHGNARPAAEGQFAAAEPYLRLKLDPKLDRAKFPPEALDDQGRVVVNPAGIDLSLGAWAELGVNPEVAYGGRFSDWVAWAWDYLEARE